ncbi:MAG: multidrug effflux MFS transporter [Bacteroidales bacterium]|nr:multidrug effflux MFS transporter [Bacteroidales bacterium]MDE7126466.1 multidrug effflux MFS transporter [Bacteroidales bacterium]
MNKKTLVFILGNLTAFGPFITDFYLPCLPELTDYFSASASMIQLSITAGMLGLAAGQMLIGPLADKYGRKGPMLWCLLLFVMATIGCIMSVNIQMFVFFRLLQGLTGSAGLVISKVIIADSFTGKDVAHYFAVLAAVQGAAPIVAPVIGGVAFSLTSWQGTFAVLGTWALILLLVCRRMDETLIAEERLKMPIWKTFKCYIPVFRNGKYMAMNLLQSFASAALMAYISASPFIFQQHFGLTPLMYSICFACNASGLVIGSSAVMKVKNLPSIVPWCTAGLSAAGILVSAALLLEWPFFIFEAAVFLMLFCVGMMTPTGITLALDSVNENRGIASALLGSLPFLLGGIVAPLTGLGNMIYSMSAIIVTCCFICIMLYLWSRRWKY